MRKVPLAKAVLPPRLSRGARSSTRTLAPFSRAESAAHMAAPPPHTTITSCDICAVPVSLLSCPALRLSCQRSWEKVNARKGSHRIGARSDCGAGPCAELSGAADQAGGAVRRRGSGRYGGPPASAGDEQGPDRGGRERQRGWREHRRDLCVPRGAGRLHPAVSSTWDGDQPVSLLQARIRPAGF